MYLQFNTAEEAEAANNKISQNMGLTGDLTVSWSIVESTTAGQFIIPKPEEKFMTGINGFEVI